MTKKALHPPNDTMIRAWKVYILRHRIYFSMPLAMSVSESKGHLTFPLLLVDKYHLYR